MTCTYNAQYAFVFNELGMLYLRLLCNKSILPILCIHFVQRKTSVCMCIIIYVYISVCVCVCVCWGVWVYSDNMCVCVGGSGCTVT